MKQINGRTAIIVVNVLTAGWMLLGSTAARAHFGETPPKGLVTDGVWLLNSKMSDDADRVVGAARENAHSERSSDPAPHVGGNTGGHRGSGGGRHGHRGASTDDATAAVQTHGQSNDDILTGLEKNADRLSFKAQEGSVLITSGTDGFECDAGGKSAIEDGIGDAERSCGWDGRAWVVETNRGHAGLRSDRYEFSKDGKTLTYTTLVTGGRFPKVKLKRVYQCALARPLT